jgi:tetratricopeptide (TPR) repeat protein/two-component sensor histidine kinase
MRNKTFLLFILITVIHATGIAQQDKIADSLLNVLKTQKEDTNKVNTLNRLSNRFSQRKEYELSNKYSKDAISLAEKLNFKRGILNAYSSLGTNNYNLHNYKEAIQNFRTMMKFAEELGYKNALGYANKMIGNSFFNQGETTEAQKYYFRSAKLYEESGNKPELASAYYNIGNSYFSLSNFTEAIKALMISLRLNKEIGDKRKIASNHIDIGNYYSALGNYPEALENYLASLKISEELGYKWQIGSAYNNIGNIYDSQGNYPEAKKNYLAGLKLFKEINNNTGIQNSYNNLGSIYQLEGNYTEAMKNHLAALKINEEIKYLPGWGNSYREIGNTYFLQNNYHDALKSYQASLKLFKEMENSEWIAEIYTNIGETYFKLNEFPEARQYFNDALSIAQEIQAKGISEGCYQNLAKLDSVSGNWEGAFINHKLFLLYRDSLVNEKNSNKITEMMMQFEFDKKEDSLKLQQAYTDQELMSQTLLARQHQQSLLLKEKEFTLMNNEKQLQQLQFEKHQADFTAQKIAQKADADTKQGQLVLLNKEKAIQTLELNKQKSLKNYLLAGIVLLAILSFFVYKNYRTRQKLNLQTLRNKIASDLHDDVGSTLSSISIFSQMAQQQSKEVNPLLDTIGESSRKMLDAMADIVWTINPENDQFEKIILRMRSFAYELLGAKKIDFEFVADDYVTKINVPMNVRKNFYLIFKEATNNMVKYAAANRASFSVKEEKNNLIMLIKDNGKGFDTSQSTEGNGLKNMKKRAGEIGGQLVIESGPGKGTEIQLRVAV